MASEAMYVDPVADGCAGQAAKRHKGGSDGASKASRGSQGMGSTEQQQL